MRNRQRKCNTAIAETFSKSGLPPETSFTGQADAAHDATHCAIVHYVPIAQSGFIPEG